MEPDRIVPVRELGRVHLIGIGGAGLSAIARLLHAQGVAVSGSDAADTAVVRALVEEGIDARTGHDAARVDGVDTVVVSSAVQDDNPELAEARRRGLRVWSRAAGLESVLASTYAVTVTGTHGKTTTAAMLVSALVHAGMDPSFAIGADVPAFGGNARMAGNVCVAEADESDGAFLVYTSATAIVTNVDPDHLDVWHTERAYREAFAEFIGNVRDRVVLCADDPGIRSMGLAGNDPRFVWAGFASDADVQATNLVVEESGTTFDVVRRGHEAVRVRLAVVGAHFALDAVLAFAAGASLGAEPQLLADGLSLHSGASRRMEYVGEAASVAVYDSYAHHPSEIRADIAAARVLAGNRRLVVAFQPHLVSRTRRHAGAIGAALAAADMALVSDIFLAREDPDPDVHSGLIVQDAEAGRVWAAGDLDATVNELVRAVRPGDVVVTMGAGDITTAGSRLLAALA